MHALQSPLLYFFVLVLIALGTAYYAHYLKRSPFVWFFMGALFGVFAPLALYFITSYITPEEGESVAEEEKEEAKNKTLPLISDKELSPVLLKQDALEKDSLLEKADENKLWYYLDANHLQMGPISIIGLRELWNTGKLGLKSYVWSSGMKEWKRVEELNDLRATLNSIQI